MDNNNQVEMVNIPIEDEAVNQVLNMTEVEELAKLERRNSRRPAIMFMFAGVLAIVLGISFPYLMSALGNDEYLDSSNMPEEVVAGGDTEEEIILDLVCTSEVVDDVKQVTYKNTVSFNFNTNGLTGYVKTMNVTPIDPINEVYVTELNAFTLLNVDVAGYTLMTVDNTNSFDSTLTVDLLQFDLAGLAENYKANQFTNILYSVNQMNDEVKTIAETEGYVCE